MSVSRVEIGSHGRQSGRRSVGQRVSSGLEGCKGRRVEEECPTFGSRALTVRSTFSRNYIQPSVNLPLPTVSSEVDQGASPFVSEEWGYAGAPVKLLLRVTLPQLPALPERTWLLRDIAVLADARSFAI
jgi:hypothetical protein